MTTHQVDLFVIGGGSGGVRAARIAAQHGARVALAEASRMGGTCVIRGCVPKKLMVVASRLGDTLAEATALGWPTQAGTFDWPGYTDRVRAEVARLESVYTQNLQRVGVQCLAGRAALIDAHTVQVSGQADTWRAERILIATGSRPDHDLSLPGAQWVESSDDFFEWREQPRRVLVVGSGYIALELACLLRKLGSEVTLVVRGDTVLRGFDSDVRSRLIDALQAQGIQICWRVQVTSVHLQPDLPASGPAGVRVVRLSDGTEHVADRVLRATGRVPVTQGLGIEGLGVALDARGAIAVDEWSATSVGSLFAVGDVTGRVALTPAAIREGHAFADTHFGGQATPVNHGHIPTAVFTTPEIGTVGLTESQAREQHGAVDIYETAFRPMSEAIAGRSQRTYLKLVVDRASDRVLGAHMIGTEAGEMIQLIGVALQAGVTKRQWDSTLPVHPTVAEEWVTMRAPRP